jgi:hypothetical protein
MSELTVVKKPEIAVVGGMLNPTTIDEAFRVANALAVSGILPTRFKTPESVFAAMQFAAELGLKPITAMRQIAVIQGTPCIYGDLPLAVCMSSGLIEWIKEWNFDKDGKEISAKSGNLTAEAFGSVTQIKRRGDSEVIERSYTIKEAESAGLFKNPVWKSFGKRMLTYRARSQALKDKFPDALNGTAIAEYDFNMSPDAQGIYEIDAPEASSPAKELQTRFNVEDEA